MAKQIIEIGESGTNFIAKLQNNFNDLYGSLDGVQTVGYIIQNDDNISLESWWTNAVLFNKVFIIASDYDFSGATITLPENVILLFNGGVWSNGTIEGDNASFWSYGNQQCFSVDLTLTGNWNIPYITPQHYGAITNADSLTLENECSAAIQKCFDSLFHVYIPSGYYYITTGLVINLSKNITLDRCSRLEITTYLKDHTRIYTDQDIDMITLAPTAQKVSIGGHGCLDSSLVTLGTKNFISIDMNYNLGKQLFIDIGIQGDSSNLTIDGNGRTGLYFDTQNCTVNGQVAFSKFILEISGVKYGVYLPEGNLQPTYGISENDFEIHAKSFKQILRIDGDNNWNRYTITGNCIPNSLSDTEKVGEFQYCVYGNIFNSVIDMCVYDITGVAANTQSRICYDKGGNNFYVGRSFWFANYGMIHFSPESVPAAGGFFGDNTYFNLHNVNRGTSIRDENITYFNNTLSYFEDRGGSATVNAYDGTGYDYDANLTESTALSAATGLVIANRENLFRIRGLAMTITGTDDTKKSNEFVEVVINNPEGNLYNLRLLWGATGVNFNKVQAIVVKVGGTIITNTYDVSKFIGSGSESNTFNAFPIFIGGVTKIILRFIGLTAIDINLGIRDIFAQKTLGPSAFPLIDIGGDQTIYGSLTVNDGVKESNLPVYADNTAAKVGGLVAGDPYRTATGIRMVVYD